MLLLSAQFALAQNVNAIFKEFSTKPKVEIKTRDIKDLLKESGINDEKILQDSINNLSAADVEDLAGLSDEEKKEYENAPDSVKQALAATMQQFVPRLLKMVQHLESVKLLDATKCTPAVKALLKKRVQALDGHGYDISYNDDKNIFLVKSDGKLINQIIIYSNSSERCYMGMCACKLKPEDLASFLGLIIGLGQNMQN